MKYALQRCTKCLILRAEPCSAKCPIIPFSYVSEDWEDRDLETRGYEKGASERTVEIVRRLQPCGSKQVADAIGKPLTTVTSMLYRLAEQGRLIKSAKSKRVYIWRVAEGWNPDPEVFYQDPSQCSAYTPKGLGGGEAAGDQREHQYCEPKKRKRTS